MAGKSKVQGEGDYEAARRYDKAQEAFANSGKVGAKAREAKAALDGPEAKSLEDARKAAAKGKTG
ncbi:MAG TPA: hypothetical protein VGH15_15685 [Caulobacteraceae bacterium]